MNKNLEAFLITVISALSGTIVFFLTFKWYGLPIAGMVGILSTVLIATSVSFFRYYPVKSQKV